MCFRFVSISLVFVNKTLLSGQNDEKALEAPLFVAWFQCFVSVGIISFIGAISIVLPFNSSSSSSLEKLHTLSKHLIDFKRLAIKVSTADINWMYDVSCICTVFLTILELALDRPASIYCTKQNFKSLSLVENVDNLQNVILFLLTVFLDLLLLSFHYV